MDLYRKKVNFGSQPVSVPDERNEDKKISASKRLKKLYLYQAQKQNQSQYAPSRPNAEDILSDENNKNRPQYFYQRNRDFQSPDSQFQKRYDKSYSPRGRGVFENKDDNIRTSPFTKTNNLSREPYYSAVGKSFNNEPKGRNKYNISNIKRKNFKTTYEGDDEDYEDAENDIDSSAYGEEIMPRMMQTSRSPDPITLRNQFNSFMGRPKYPDIRSKDVQIMPKVRKQNKDLNNNTNLNTDEEVDDLYKTIDNLQNTVNKQRNEIRNIKQDNFTKNKRINKLKNEVNDLQKELNDKRGYPYKDDDRRDLDNHSKLKKEYYKLLQDYDNNVNDFNNLKDDYNKMVDEFSNLKNEKKKLSEDNKHLKENNSQLKDDYKSIKNEANKALDDYNNIVDDYNKLDRENRKCQNELNQLRFDNDRLKQDYERIRVRMKGKQTKDEKDQDFNKLNDDYDRLNDDYDKLNNDYRDLKKENEKIKNENKQLKKDLDDISQPPRDEDYDRLYEGFNNLKKENQELKNKLRNKIAISPFISKKDIDEEIPPENQENENEKDKDKEKGKIGKDKEDKDKNKDKDKDKDKEKDDPKKT